MSQQLTGKCIGKHFAVQKLTYIAHSFVFNQKLLILHTSRIKMIDICQILHYKIILLRSIFINARVHLLS